MEPASGMRNQSIDLIRGIAILIMMLANLWPRIYPFDDCPLLLRILFSSAAPLFVFLSGVSVKMALDAGKSARELALRAFQVLVFAGFIDVFIWRILPLYVMDVLYVIAFSMVLLLGVRKLNVVWHYVLALALIGGAFAFQAFYEFKIHTVGLRLADFNLVELGRHMVLDGWFPVLPWSGFAVLGYATYASREAINKHTKWFFISGLLMLAAYFSTAFIVLEFAPLRKEYTEVFYPAASSFLIYAFGLFALVVCGYKVNVTAFRFVSDLGKISLTMYLLHFVLIGYFIPGSWVQKEVFNPYVSLGLIVAFYSVLLVLAHGIRKNLHALKRGKYKLLGKALGL